MYAKNISTHVQILGWLFILGNAIVLFMGLFALVVLPAIGLISQDPTAVSVLGTIGVAGATFFTLLALPGLIAGYGLLKQRPWARILALVLAFFELFQFPVGTALGVYAFWVLLQDGADEYFAPFKMV
jgi:hypothetical protein